jgi:hypothetical protein
MWGFWWIVPLIGLVLCLTFVAAQSLTVTVPASQGRTARPAGADRRA